MWQYDKVLSFLAESYLFFNIPYKSLEDGRGVKGEDNYCTGYIGQLVVYGRYNDLVYNYKLSAG
jgi:hypothetical protein